MSTTIITIPARHIFALKQFATNCDVPPYLIGLCFEIYKDAIYGVASDGKIMGAFRVEPKKELNIDAPITNLIIPLDIFKNLNKKSLGVDIEIGEVVEKKVNSRKVKVWYDGFALECETIDGEFPDWRKVVPATTSGEPAQFDSKLLERVRKARGAFHKDDWVFLGHNGNGPALAHVTDDFFAVIMPLYNDDKNGRVVAAPPKWALPKG